MNFFQLSTMKINLNGHYLVLMLSCLFSGGANKYSGIATVSAQEVDNIDGAHTVYEGDHFADCTSTFCFSGPDWGNNGKKL